ncbi:MAG: EFR1 family ferrodoxin [Lachnospiraceae bacterium]|nr:EFR1 family ferrodoxin [Lachnospiraceae bacterium]
MIIYFSGTGNSLYAAKSLLEENERLVSMADMIKEKSYDVGLESGERLGLVFPVYFYTVPSIVKDFLEKAEIKNAGYVFAVITCGGGTAQASAVLKKILAGKGITLSYFRELLMPDNSMLFYQIPGTDKARGRLDDAAKVLADIKKDIEERKTTAIGDNTMISSLIGLGYRLCSGTKKFYAEDTCTGCGLCARNCPMQVIVMKDKRPVWTEEKCCKCSTCINRCPVKAIQYGKATKKRNRYVNPLV